MTERTKIEALRAGDEVRWTDSDPLVTVLRVKRDRMGFDVLYQHGGSEPRWRGFDDGDSVILESPAPVVRDPESWQAVAREGRRYA